MPAAVFVYSPRSKRSPGRVGGDELHVERAVVAGEALDDHAIRAPIDELAARRRHEGLGTERMHLKLIGASRTTTVLDCR